eukprot:TRINITY_DN2044_c0_g1_i1.p1 TRINITY_DN2044_c0_g1~~TRINITY_DN2044_c0_g1_i1.p1  ORF type:complete len:315 (-),score=38.23 TRINITY_DN2044_c0_g1_i1:440-1384(-)
MFPQASVVIHVRTVTASPGQKDSGGKVMVASLKVRLGLESHTSTGTGVPVVVGSVTWSQPTVMLAGKGVKTGGSASSMLRRAELTAVLPQRSAKVKVMRSPFTQASGATSKSFEEVTTMLQLSSAMAPPFWASQEVMEALLVGPHSRSRLEAWVVTLGAMVSMIEKTADSTTVLPQLSDSTKFTVVSAWQLEVATSEGLLWLITTDEQLSTPEAPALLESQALKSSRLVVEKRSHCSVWSWGSTTNEGSVVSMMLKVAEVEAALPHSSSTVKVTVCDSGQVVGCWPALLLSLKVRTRAQASVASEPARVATQVA